MTIGLVLAAFVAVQRLVDNPDVAFFVWGGLANLFLAVVYLRDRLRKA